jgi:lipoprotein signal peptidase
MKAPSRKTGLLCLVIFVLALIGAFVPLGHLPYVGAAFGLVNHYHEWLLIAGYALLLLAVYIL